MGQESEVGKEGKEIEKCVLNWLLLEEQGDF